MTRAESIALAAVTPLVAAIVVPYLLDLAGFGIAPIPTVVAALAAGCAVPLVARPSRSSFGEFGLLLGAIIGSLVVLLRMTGPSLLPTGSGPDLTHHLLLVDYIDRHRTLVRDADAGRYLGEMAHYTPGLHLLAVIGGAAFRTNALFAVFPVVALSVALKFGVFALISLRLFKDLSGRVMAAAAGTSLVLFLSPFTIQSFTHDSFLAQVLAELFAMVMWWALLAWDQTPSRQTMIVFAASGTATFLTWPLFVGPLIVALVLLVAAHGELRVADRGRDALIAIAPIAVVSAIHVYGRSEGLGLVATSGAVTQPSFALVGWWLPPLAVVGIAVAVRHARSRPLIALIVGLVLQAGGLWIVARWNGATTPYMAIKMMYLAVYPLVAAAMLAITRVCRTPGALAIPALILVLLSLSTVSRVDAPAPTVSRDLWAVGTWAREHLPAACIDYLVGNEYSAYWLHLAVLGNPRAAARSADNDTFLTQPAMARWLAPDGGVPYAIARLSVLPAEIRERTRVLYQHGDALVIARGDGSTACGQ